MSYQQQTVRELRTVAKERGIKYFVFMNKARLVEVLKQNDDDPTFTTCPDAKEKCFANYLKWRDDPKNRERYVFHFTKYNQRVRAKAKRLQEERKAEMFVIEPLAC